MLMKKFLFFSLLLLIGACQTTAPAPTLFQNFLETNGRQYDLLVYGGNIIDGTGAPSYKADLLIKDDQIVFIGAVDTAEIETVKIIDATEKIVSPGFIDTHAHGNPFSTPGFENFLAMGVTTICLGQDGSSPQEDMGGWMQRLQQTPIGVNIAMFIGHGTLRKLSGINFDKQPSTNKLAQQQQLLKAAMELGCFGMSTGLEYTPGTFAEDSELIPLAKIISAHDGLIMSHIRNEDDDQVETSIQELLRQGQYCNVQVSHMKAVYGQGKERANQLLTLLETPENSNYTVTADVYPYTASYTGIGIVFPKWAKPPNNYTEVVKHRRAELLAFLKQKIIDRNGPEATLFGTAPYAGKTLAQVSEEQGLPYEKVLLGIGPNRASGAYFIMDDELQETIIAHPKVMICSDGSPTMRHPRGYGTFAKIIEEYVLKREKMTLEVAIHKMTGLSAKTLGIEKRGLLKENHYADLLIFNPEKIKANATYENPHQLASGFDFVIVNGQLNVVNESNNINSQNINGRLLSRLE